MFYAVTMSRMLRTPFAAVLLTLAVACSPAPPETLAEMPDIDTNRVLADITHMSSDEFQGRAPGGEGERLTIEFLT
jgi:hypothetical protein